MTSLASAHVGHAEIVCTVDALGRYQKGETLLVARSGQNNATFSVTVDHAGRQWIGKTDENPPIPGTTYPIIGRLH